VSKVSYKTLWVTSIQTCDIGGESYVPTALQYVKDNVIYGSDALKMERENSPVISNFKVDLGNFVPGVSVRKSNSCKIGGGKEKSVYEVTKDYMDAILGNVEKELPAPEEGGFKLPAKIIVAEPLSFQVAGYSLDWVANYRANIRRILSRYQEVEFLPEPFAVYQYYRYGQKLPHLQNASKHIALILDFGGGTFDACIIESTLKGDISQTGKHSKPLAADSIPVGGFVVNFEIAKYLIKRNLEGPAKKKSDSYLEQYLRIKKGDLELEVLRPEAQIFIANFERLIGRCENYKLNLARIIKSWALKGDAYDNIIVEVPGDPFGESALISVEFYAHQFRELFIRKIWEPKLHRVISNVLARGRNDLKSREITVTLVSGGSANIRWMHELLMRDFDDELHHAEPVPISHSFQEVVANGLAIECARRFYVPSSEFVSVTYNPIKLYLRSDSSEFVKDKKFKSVEDTIDMSNAKGGDLIPSAQSLNYFFDKEIQWKFKLKPPKYCLEYFFLRPESGDEFDCYNVAESRVFTDDNKHFDQNFSLQLTIKEDGTAYPKFIYCKENQEFGGVGNEVVGKPFYIDMTSSIEGETTQSHYVGFDFGTSNSSLCLLSDAQISLIDARNKSSTWTGISNALSKLPYPVAFQVRKFISSQNQSETADKAREAFESCLAFMAYTAVAEVGVVANEQFGEGLKSYQHRSLGPIKALLEGALKALGNKAAYSYGYKEWFENNKTSLDQAIEDFNLHKHHKNNAEEINWQNHVELVVHPIAKAMENYYFGYCSTSEQLPFEDTQFEGVFILAQDNAPFVTTLRYKSERSINSALALLIDHQNGQALSMLPYLFWWDVEDANQSHKCFWYDKLDKEKCALVKPCDKNAVIKASDLNQGLDTTFKKLFNENKHASQMFKVSIDTDD
jgi:hypothetical protein